MTTLPDSDELELTAERVLPFPVDQVWDQCTSKSGLAHWWSPEDIRTEVRRLEARPGGVVAMSLRYAPALVSTTSEAAFRAAGVPVSLTLRGSFLELVPNRRIVLELTLSLDRAGAGITNVTEIDLEPEGSGTRVRISVRGKSEKHMVTLGKANLEGQLDRLGRRLAAAAD